MKKTYVMVRTKDRRCFVTDKKNLPELIEFAQTLGAEVSLVQCRSNDILPLADLAPAICNGEYSFSNSCRVIKTILPKRKAKKIGEFIQRRLLKKQVVSLKLLRKKYPSFSIPYLCNRLSQIRKELALKGYPVRKTGQGRYQIL